MPKARLLDAVGAALLVLVAAFSIRAMAPPAPVGEAAPPGLFSADRAAKHLRAISREVHPCGSKANDEVRAYLVQALRELGLEPELQTVNAASRTAGRISSGTVVNVAARLRGTAGSAKAVMLAAHYDSVPQSFGAADDGSAVATLLETARALKSLPPLRRDVILLFTDGEELTLLGAQGFIEEHPWRDDVGLVINFDCRGTSGTATMFETSAHVGGLVEVLAASPRPSASSAVTALAKALPNGTDLTAFNHAGYPGMGFAFAEGFADYHTAWDNLANLDLASVQDEGDHALALVRAFGRSATDLGERRDAVYFDLLRRVLVRYGLPLAWGFAATTLAAFAWLLVRLRRGGLRWGSVAAGAGLLLAAVLLAAAATWLATAAAAWGFPLELALRQVAFRAVQAFSVAAAMLLLGFALLQKRFDPQGLAVGALSVWALGLAVLALLVPSASFAVQWPLLFTVAAIASGRRWALYLAAAASLVLLAPLGYSLHVAAGNGAPSVTAGFGALVGVLFLPMLVGLSRRATALAGVALLAAAVLVIPVARLAVGSGQRADYLSHATDADAGAARWLAGARSPTSSLAEKRVPADTRPELGDIDPAFGSHRGAAAPLVEKPAPVIEVLDRPGALSPRRRVELAVRSQARCVHLWQESGATISTVSINGKPVPDLARFSAELDTSLMRLLTGDRSPDLWKAKHCGPAGAELHIVVEAPGSEKVPVRLVEAFDGLPPGVERRAEGLVPANGGDMCFVARRLRI
ncbi:MAG TPA: M20/M25/M40 family metallo-hydrolase [Myxococcales bacterium]|jgi:hypothetical protein